MVNKILIVEDDPQILKSLKLNLKLSGYDVHEAATIQNAWDCIKHDHFDLICMDIGLPDGSGLDLCEKVRLTGDDTPIFFLSARTDEATVVKAMSIGGDEYLRKPFGMEELKLRMQKLMRHVAPPAKTIIFGALTIDPMKRVVKIMDQMVTLGRKEIEILTLLAKKAGDIVSRDTILDALYDKSELYDRTIDSHVSHLRRKLREAAGESLRINSVYGLGYRLEWN